MSVRKSRPVIAVAALALTTVLSACGEKQNVPAAGTAPAGATSAQATKTRTRAAEPTVTQKTGKRSTQTGTTAADQTATQATGRTTGTTASKKAATIDLGGEKGGVAFGSRQGCIEWAQGWPAPQRQVILAQCNKLPR